MKKLTSIVLTLIMMLCMATTAFAATNTNQGKITIDNAISGETYSIYQIFVLESYSEPAEGEAGAFAYTIASTSPWYDFVTGEGAGAAYVVLSPTVTADADATTHYVTWSDEKNTDTDAANFAQAAKAYATDNNISATASAQAEGTTVEFTELSLGYYLVDTSLGTLCSLDTTDAEVTISEKNIAPTIEKTVEEDSTNTYGESNTAQIGDTVNFKTVIKAYAGAENYVVHDKMSAGLTFNTTSVVVKVGETVLTASTDYTVVTENLDSCTTNQPIQSGGCTFHIVFTKEYLDKVTGTTENPTEITITYSAVLNENAVISTAANINDTKLTYADNNATEVDHTDTYTYSFDLIKTDADNVLLTGAEFELYDAKTGGNKINIVKEQDGTYRIATSKESSAENFTSASIEVTNGKVVVEGLDANTTYWLEETVAPDGYNKLKERVEVKMESANLTATINQGQQSQSTWTSGGVHVVNNTGSELPSTGGIGTTIFYVIGGGLVIAALVLLIVKKRMNTAK